MPSFARYLLQHNPHHHHHLHHLHLVSQHHPPSLHGQSFHLIMTNPFISSCAILHPIMANPPSHHVPLHHIITNPSSHHVPSLNMFPTEFSTPFFNQQFGPSLLACYFNKTSTSHVPSSISFPTLYSFIFNPLELKLLPTKNFKVLFVNIWPIFCTPPTLHLMFSNPFKLGSIITPIKIFRPSLNQSTFG